MLNYLQKINLIKRWIFKIFKCIKKNSNLILGLSSIIVSILVYNIYQKQTEIFKEQVYPHFNVYTYLGDEMINEKYAHKNLNVDNNGGNFYELEVESVPFLIFERMGKKYFITANSFFGIKTRYSSKKDSTVYKFIGYKNNLKLANLSDMLIKKGYGIVYEEIYIKIFYQDVFGESHTQYFLASTGKLLQNEIGLKKFKEFNEGLKRISYKMFDELTVDDLIKYSVPISEY